MLGQPPYPEMICQPDPTGAPTICYVRMEACEAEKRRYQQTSIVLSMAAGAVLASAAWLIFRR